jgi:hypothetical protein
LHRDPEFKAVDAFKQVGDTRCSEFKSLDLCCAWALAVKHLEERDVKVINCKNKLGHDAGLVLLFRRNPLDKCTMRGKEQ